MKQLKTHRGVGAKLSCTQWVWEGPSWENLERGSLDKGTLQPSPPCFFTELRCGPVFSTSQSWDFLASCCLSLSKISLFCQLQLWSIWGEDWSGIQALLFACLLLDFFFFVFLHCYRKPRYFQQESRAEWLSIVWFHPWSSPLLPCTHHTHEHFPLASWWFPGKLCLSFYL